MNTRSAASTPAVNIRETENAYFIEMATPGFGKDDFTIDLHDKTLTVSGQKSESESKSEGNFTRKEFAYSSFQRSFNLSEKHVDRDSITADYANGVLNIRIDKAAQNKEQSARRIEIK